jgi:hypothetical protein
MMNDSSVDGVHAMDMHDCIKGHCSLDTFQAEMKVFRQVCIVAYK